MSNHLRAITRLFVDTFGSVRWADNQGYAAPRFDTLPTCTASIEGTEGWVRGGTGVASTQQVCVKQADDTYAWTPFAGGQNDEQFAIYDDGDSTKRAMFETSGITTATTRTLTVPNASGTIALTTHTGGKYVPFIVYDGVSVTDWQNMPLAGTEFKSNIHFRKRADLTGCTDFRLLAQLAVAGAAAAILRVDYTLDLTGATGWAVLGTQATQQISLAATGNVIGAWTAIATAAKTSVLLRLVGIGGDGVVDPFPTNIEVEFR